MKPILSFILTLSIASLSAQSVKQDKMEALSFMVGEWVGTSTLFLDGVISRQVPAFERISYDLDSSIIVIELNSETLKLHTIIRYDQEDNTYYYHAFSERSAGKLPASMIDGRFVVQATADKRYIFERTGENSFREFGEQRKDGGWVKYFEDTFTDTR